MDFLEPFSLGPSLVLLTGVAGALILAHTLLLAAGLGLRLENSAPGLGRLSASLGVAGPVAVGLLMIFVVQDGFGQMLPGQASSAASFGRAAVGLARAMNGWTIGGLGLVALALTGPIGLAVLRWRVRGGGSRPDALLRAILFVNLVAGALGAAVVYRIHGMTTGFAAMAGASGGSRAEFLVMLLSELPSLSWLVILLAAIVLVGAFAFMSGWEAGSGPKGGRALLVVALSIYSLGCLAFVATRGHAGDRQGVLPALFERLRAGDDRSILMYSSAVLPTLKKVRKLEPAPTIGVQGAMVVVDGVPLAADRLSVAQDPLVLEMAERLERLHAQWQLIHPGEEQERRAILQLDVDTPAPLLARVFAACRRAGYEVLQLATLETTTIHSQVLGPLELVTYRALFVDLVDEGTAGAQPWQAEKYGDLALRLDGAAKEGRVRLQVPAGVPAGLGERLPLDGSDGSDQATHVLPRP